MPVILVEQSAVCMCVAPPITERGLALGDAAVLVVARGAHCRVPPAPLNGAAQISFDEVAGIRFVMDVEVTVDRGLQQGNRHRSMIGGGGDVVEPVREIALDFANSRFDAALDGSHIFGEFGVGDGLGGGFLGHAGLARAQLPENVKVGEQLDVVGNRGELAHQVMARGRSERFAGGEIQFDVIAQPVDRASALARYLAQRLPGSVFKKYGVEAVEAVVIADIPQTLGRVGTIRRRDRANVYLLNPHFVLANISKEQWQCFASLQPRCQN
jgi:hypothetical protein